MWLSFRIFDYFKPFDNKEQELHIIHSCNELYLLIFIILILLSSITVSVIFKNKEIVFINLNKKEDIPLIDFLKKEKELKILFKIFLIQYKKIMRDKRPDIERKKELDILVSWFDSYLSQNYLKVNNMNIDEKFIENEINNYREVMKKMYLVSE